MIWLEIGYVVCNQSITGRDLNRDIDSNISEWQHIHWSHWLGNKFSLCHVYFLNLKFMAFCWVSEIQTKNKSSVFALTTIVSKTRTTNWVRFLAYISGLCIIVDVKHQTFVLCLAQLKPVWPCPICHPTICD